MLIIFVLAILIVFVFDFAKIRQQNRKVIEQNDKIISLLEEIKTNKN